MKNCSPRKMVFPELSDATLVLDENHEFHVHRMILANQSHFFFKLFYDNQFKEANQRRMSIQAPIDAFEKILKFLYTATIEVTENVEEILAILELSRRYEIQKLENVLIGELCRMVTIENFAVMRQTANLLDSKILEEKIWQVVDQNSKEFLETNDFLKLNKVEVVTLFARKTFKARNIDKFIAISNYLEDNKDVRKYDLLRFVDLRKLQNNQLIRIVAPTKLYNLDHLMKIMVSRDEDVKLEEIIHYEVGKIDVRENQVVMGQNRPFLLLSERNKFCSGEFHNGQFLILIDLGENIKFNFMQFMLKSTEEGFEDYDMFINFGFTIETSSNKHDWTEILKVVVRDFRYGPQKIGLPNVEARYIKFNGNMQINSFEIHDLHAPMERVFPKGSLVTLEHVVVEEMDGYENMFKEPGFNEYDPEITFAEGDSMNITFFHPLPLTGGRIRFYDFDGRRHSFKISVFCSGEDQYKGGFNWLATAGKWSDFDLKYWPISYIQIKCDYVEINHDDDYDAEMRIVALEIY